MSIPSSLTLNYDAVLSTTLFNYRRKLEDNISTANAFYYMVIKKRGAYEELSDIGDRMQMPLMYQLGTADSYSGYDQLDVTPMDGITSAFYDWRQASVPIAISGLEEKKNRSEARIISLLESKVKQAEIGVKQFFNQSLLQGNGINTATAITTAYTSNMNGSLFVDPVPMQVAYTVSGSLTVGNINQSTSTWWRNQTSTSTASSYAGFLKEITHLRNNCAKGPGGPPDMYLFDQNTWELYNAALTTYYRNPTYKSADIPFENLEIFGTMATWDEFVPNASGGTTAQSTTAGTMYAFNTQFWGVKVDAETNFTTTPFIKPENQDAKVAHILWLGAVGLSNRRKQGVLGAINTTITS